MGAIKISACEFLFYTASKLGGGKINAFISGEEVIIVSPRYVCIVEKCCPCGHVNTKQVRQVLY